MNNENIVSGIRPTGKLHLGNYFGAVKSFVEMQHHFNCFFFIADYHALTTHPDASNLKIYRKQIVAEYLACGLDPELCTIYVQSQIPEISELYLLLNMNAYLGELERCTSFKDKVRTQPNNVNAGLLTYPVLMTADILIHKGTKVPVGKDQEQHLEIARDLADRFNKLHNNEYFPLPQAFNFDRDLIKVPSLSGNGKMGKSENDKYTIFLTDSPEIIVKKIKQSPTDSGPTVLNSSKPESISALFDIMKAVSTEEIHNHYNELYLTCKIKYKDLKEQLAKDIINFLNPIQEEIDKYLHSSNVIDKIIKEGKEKATNSARATIKDVRSIIGLD
ncbi:MAG: tryptophan--tRNA ligase [Solitalea-like symbiont of Acarus siro]